MPTRTRRTISRPSTGQEVLAVRELEFSAGLSVRANFRGCTALHYAALTESLEVMEVLLRAGADLLWTNDYGHTPGDYAGSRAARELLAAHTERLEKRREREERRRFPLEQRRREVMVGRMSSCR